MQRFATVDGDPHTRSKPLPHILGPPSASTQEVPHQRPCPPTPTPTRHRKHGGVRAHARRTHARTCPRRCHVEGPSDHDGGRGELPPWRARPQLPIVAGHPPHGCACPPSPPIHQPPRSRRVRARRVDTRARISECACGAQASSIRTQHSGGVARHQQLPLVGRRAGARQVARRHAAPLASIGAHVHRPCG